ncbi:MAG: hypothetical protein GY679_01360 [Mycoplasma sp.]|nr:hypothetical protein [Mycoplasma sp.]
MGIEQMTGVKPRLREYLKLQEEALNGNLAFEILTADVNEPAGAAGWTHTVTFQVVDSSGNVHSWFNEDVTATPADSSTLGTATVSDGTPTVTNGVGTVNLIGDAAAWVAAEDATMTLSHTMLGYTVTAAVFTVTIV